MSRKGIPQQSSQHKGHRVTDDLVDRIPVEPDIVPRFVFRDPTGSVVRSRRLKPSDRRMPSSTHQDHVPLLENRPSQIIVTRYGALLLRAPPAVPAIEKILSVALGGNFYRHVLSKLAQFKCKMLHQFLARDWKAIFKAEFTAMQRLLDDWLMSDGSLRYLNPALQARLDSIVLNADEKRAQLLRKFVADMHNAEMDYANIESPTLDDYSVSILMAWKQKHPDVTELYEKTAELLAFYCDVLVSDVRKWFETNISTVNSSQGDNTAPARPVRNRRLPSSLRQDSWDPKVHENGSLDRQDLEKLIAEVDSHHLIEPEPPELSQLVGSKHDPDFSPDLYPSWNWKNLDISYDQTFEAAHPVAPVEPPAPPPVSFAHPAPFNPPKIHREAPIVIEDTPVMPKFQPEPVKPNINRAAVPVPFGFLAPPPVESNSPSTIRPPVSRPGEPPSYSSPPIAAPAQPIVILSKEEEEEAANQAKMNRKKEKRRLERQKFDYEKQDGDDDPLPEDPYIIALPPLVSTIEQRFRKYLRRRVHRQYTVYPPGDGSPYPTPTREAFLKAAAEVQLKFVDNYGPMASVSMPRALTEEEKRWFEQVILTCSVFEHFPVQDTGNNDEYEQVRLNGDADNHTALFFQRKPPRPTHAAVVSIPLFQHSHMLHNDGYSLRRRETQNQHRQQQQSSSSSSAATAGTPPKRKRGRSSSENRSTNLFPNTLLAPSSSSSSPSLSSFMSAPKRPKISAASSSAPTAAAPKMITDGIGHSRGQQPTTFVPQKSGIVDAVMEKQIREQIEERNRSVGFSSYGTDVTTTSPALPPLTPEQRESYRKRLQEATRVRHEQEGVDTARQRGITRLWLKHTLAKRPKK